MVFIDDDLRLREKFFHQLSISAGHVHHNESDVFSVVVAEKVMSDHLMPSCREDIDYPAILRVCKDTLEFLAFGISFEFIDRQHFRKVSRLEVDLIHKLCCRWRGHIVVFGNAFDAAAFFQLPVDLQIHPVRELAVSWKKIDMFIESLAAVRTDMAPFTKMEDRVVPADRDIADNLGPVVVDLTSDGPAHRTVMQALFHSEVDVDISSGTFDICYG